MTYTKPELNALGNAAAVIQDFTKVGPKMSDPNISSPWQLQPAYDLDE